MKKRFGGALIALAFVFGIIATASTTVNAQWTNRSYGGYNNQAVQQGFQYGVNTGASDAQRRQTYSPQRSRYYRDAPNQAFRDGFVRGYDQGYRQYAGNYGNYGGYRNEGSYGYGGYGGGYVSTSYFQQALLVIEFVNLKVKGAVPPPSVWVANIGDLVNSYDTSTKTREAIDQAFVQSQYLKR